MAWASTINISKHFVDTDFTPNTCYHSLDRSISAYNKPDIYFSWDITVRSLEWALPTYNEPDIYLKLAVTATFSTAHPNKSLARTCAVIFNLSMEHDLFAVRNNSQESTFTIFYSDLFMGWSFANWTDKQPIFITVETANNIKPSVTMADTASLIPVNDHNSRALATETLASVE
jgi:hypothetical protein